MRNMRISLLVCSQAELTVDIIFVMRDMDPNGYHLILHVPSSHFLPNAWTDTILTGVGETSTKIFFKNPPLGSAVFLPFLPYVKSCWAGQGQATGGARLRSQTAKMGWGWARFRRLLNHTKNATANFSQLSSRDILSFRWRCQKCFCPIWWAIFILFYVIPKGHSCWKEIVKLPAQV